jgi:hypothetical protein
VLHQAAEDLKTTANEQAQVKQNDPLYCNTPPLAPAPPILTPAQLAAAHAALPPLSPLNRTAHTPVSVEFYLIFQYLY